ncbi:MAG: hypothetical protein JWR38_1451 [Mucilaginibacter sp.]|nr:hypothetical protein [Mucilaginibacter sp.]
MPKVKKIKKTTLERFVRNKIWLNLITNIIFNTAFAYLCFYKFNGIHLFEGSQNLARLVLPMSFLLPFMLTFDTLKKAMLAVDEGAMDITLSEDLNRNKFIFQLGAIHGICTLLPVLAIMLAVHFSLPAHYSFDVLTLSVVDGLVAGLYAVFFTYLSIKRLKKHIGIKQETPQPEPVTA